MKTKLNKSIIALTLGLAVPLQATTLTFDTPPLNGVSVPRDFGNGVTGAIGFYWNNIGGGHLTLNGWNSDDIMSFSTPTLVNSFDITLPKWEGASSPNGMIKVAAYDSSNANIWQTTIDLTGTTWSNWLTIDVETANVSKMVFFAPNPMFGSMINPSIDNLTINVVETQVDNRVDVPDNSGAALVLLMGLGSLALLRKSVKRTTASL